jgi:hypothetical protein
MAVSWADVVAATRACSEPSWVWCVSHLSFDIERCKSISSFLIYRGLYFYLFKKVKVPSSSPSTTKKSLKSHLERVTGSFLVLIKVKRNWCSHEKGLLCKSKYTVHALFSLESSGTQCRHCCYWTDWFLSHTCASPLSSLLSVGINSETCPPQTATFLNGSGEVSFGRGAYVDHKWVKITRIATCNFCELLF